jgi:hypothetical protein
MLSSITEIADNVGGTMVAWGFNEKRIDEPLVGGAEQYAISRIVELAPLAMATLGCCTQPVTDTCGAACREA